MLPSLSWVCVSIACLSLLPGIRTDDLQSAYNQGGRDGGGGFGGRAGIAGGGGGDGELSGVEADLLMLQSVIPGIPGEDYPILSEVPELDFACDDKVEGGKYADVTALCQVFHICIVAGPASLKLKPVSFLCPNGTLFNQQYFICDWWFNVDCNLAEGLYGLNDDIASAAEAANQNSDGGPGRGGGNRGLGGIGGRGGGGNGGSGRDGGGARGSSGNGGRRGSGSGGRRNQQEVDTLYGAPGSDQDIGGQNRLGQGYNNGNRRGGGSLNGYLAPGGDSGDVEDDDLAGYGAGDQGRQSKYYG